MKHKVYIIIVICLCLLLLCFNLSIGNVKITLSDFFSYITNSDKIEPVKQVILKTRISSTVTAFVTGAGLAVTGLLLQTLFRNPLADPSVLGISSGAGLGVAISLMMLGSTPATFIAASNITNQAVVTVASFIGTIPILLILLIVSKRTTNKLVILLTGVMISFINSSVISVIEFFSKKESLYSYMLWGMGSFSYVPSKMLWIYSISMMIIACSSLFFIKSLNAIMLGEKYAANLGIKVKRLNVASILISGLIVALATAYCGPIGFIGLAAPHIVRMQTKKADHKILLPVTILFGGIFAMFALLVTRLPGFDGALPINVVTSLIGAPVLIKILFTPSIKNQ